MFRTLRWQLSLVLFSLLFLIGGSVITTFIDAYHHDQDIAAVYLATQQRKLVYQLVYEAVIHPNSPEQAAHSQQFEENLVTLRQGGSFVAMDGHVVNLTSVKDKAILAQLDVIEYEWDLLRTRLAETQPVMLASSSGEMDQSLQFESEALLISLDELGEALEEKSYLNTTIIQLFHVGLLFIAVFLLVLGTNITRKNIIQPLSLLTETAQKIAQGERSEPLDMESSATEIGQLISAFGVMQVEIETSRLRLENRLSQRTNELTAVFEISQEIVHQPEINKVMESVTEQAKSLLNATATHLCLIDEQQLTIKLASRSGNVLNNEPDNTSLKTFPQHMIALNNTGTVTISCSDCGFLSSDYKICSAAPLIIGSKKIGALCAVRRDETQFNENDERALALLANSAAIAISNTQLMKSNEEKVRETAVLNERERIAAELHDNIAQVLSFCNLKIEQIQSMLPTKQQEDLLANLNDVKYAVETAHSQLRVALQDLKQTEAASSSDFVHDLTTIVNDFSRNFGLQIEYEFSETAVLHLPAQIQRQALFVIREALTNIQRHAQTISAHLQIVAIHGAISFIITDSGRGFYLDQLEGGGHYGISIMQERARRSGGNLTIDSVPGYGTTVILSYPHKVERTTSGEQ